MPSYVTNDVSYELPSNSEVLISYYHHVSFVISKFINLWEVEYVSALREKHYSSSHQLTSSAPVVGEIVLVKEGNSRHDWKLGRVTEINIGLDKQVREAVVKIGDKESRKSVNCLVPLELHLSSEEKSLNTSSEESTDNEVGNERLPPTENRPHRLAAVRSQAHLRQMIDSGLVE